jgi:hypothetical protein
MHQDAQSLDIFGLVPKANFKAAHEEGTSLVASICASVDKTSQPKRHSCAKGHTQTGIVTGFDGYYSQI